MVTRTRLPPHTSSFGAPHTKVAHPHDLDQPKQGVLYVMFAVKNTEALIQIMYLMFPFHDLSITFMT